MAAWALYENNDYPAAIAALNQFIELNPAHPNIDYAYFRVASPIMNRLLMWNVMPA